MKRRSRAGGEASKARGREALKTKRRDASKTASSPAPIQDAEVARLTRELTRHWSDKRRPRKCLRLSAAHRVIFSACSPPCWRTRSVSATPRLGMSIAGTATPNLVATHNTPPAFAEARRYSPFNSPNPKTVTGRMLATKGVVHVTDAAAQEGYADRSDPAAVTAVELGGVRTFLAVPMLKENELIGRSPSTARKFAPSPTSRSSWCRTSPLKRSIRHRECATAQRASSIAAAADGDCRRSESDQPFNVRFSDCIEHAGPVRRKTVQG